MDTFCTTNSTTVWTTVCAHQSSFLPVLLCVLALALVGAVALARR